MSTHEVFIASYEKDFPWLDVNLRSLRRFSEGFLPPVVCVERHEVRSAKQYTDGAHLCAKDGRGPGTGFLRAQIAMMCADIMCPSADYIYLLGSDCMAFRRFAPDVYWFRDKPVMLYNSYAELGNMDAVGMWQGSTEQVLGFSCPNETMRRLPLVYPRELFPAVRKHIEDRHGMAFEDYIYKKGHPLSESNILGCYALKFMPERYTWLHASPSDPSYVEYRTPLSDSIAQFWSHGGLDHPQTLALDYAPGKNTHGKTPREIIRDVLG
jgi:hypothetical protein